jgi:hypothetical protein
MSRNTFVFAMLLVLGLASGWTAARESRVPGRVRSSVINQATCALTPVNDVPSMGSITAHLSTDRTGRCLAKGD